MPVNPLDMARANLRDRLPGIASKDLERDEAAIKQKMEAVDKLFNEQVRAKYKLEIQFHEARSTNMPFVGVMYFLLNGNKFNGGGDSKVYLCATDTCHGIIEPSEQVVTNLDEDPEQIKPAKMLCPKCNTICLAGDLWGERLLRLYSAGWAKAILENFRYLEQNADVSIVLHYSELQKSTKLEIDKQADGDVVREARRVRRKAIYPLRNIISDTANGAELYNRFLAFINAA